MNHTFTNIYSTKEYGKLLTCISKKSKTGKDMKAHVKKFEEISNQINDDSVESIGQMQDTMNLGIKMLKLSTSDEFINSALDTCKLEYIKVLKKTFSLVDADAKKTIVFLKNLEKSERKEKAASYKKCILEADKNTDLSLCSRGYCSAKEKFKVYPSAYANGYASQVCYGKQPDALGEKKAEGKKK